MIYTVNVVDDQGDHHGWIVEGMGSAAEALARTDRVLAEDCPGRRRFSAEVFRSTADGQPRGGVYKYGAAEVAIG